MGKRFRKRRRQRPSRRLPEASSHLLASIHRATLQSSLAELLQRSPLRAYRTAAALSEGFGSWLNLLSPHRGKAVKSTRAKRRGVCEGVPCVYQRRRWRGNVRLGGFNPSYFFSLSGSTARRRKCLLSEVSQAPGGRLIRVERSDMQVLRRTKLTAKPLQRRIFRMRRRVACALFRC